MLPFLVPVESHTNSRASSRPADPVPEAGAAWGQSSAFSIEDPDSAAGDPRDEAESPEEEEKRRRGITIIWPQKHIYTSRTIDFSPVWRRYDIAEVTARDDPDVKIEVAVTRELLFPIRSETMKYVGGGSYVIHTGGRGYETRVVHSYLHLVLPILSPGWTIKEFGLTEGEWPDYPDEMFPPGPFA
ncbi:MAG: hypothetical protein ACU0B9_07345 [Limimaricola soesokkakensis]|uniref:hypothetical protein n=1 Tax=Limimaricola soesokkakensis TaxID=1343159 RepID=UPI004059D1BC